MTRVDFAVIGGGIVGLATALSIGRRFQKASVAVLEKEADLALHQTGRNSGVIHSGIYYKPGSFKARFARAGSQSMVHFCREHGIAHEVCGKLIVATRETEVPGLEALLQRGRQNELEVERVSPEAVREIEPHVRCVAALQVRATGIVNYRQVSLKYAELIRAQGGEICFGAGVNGIRDEGGRHRIETASATVDARFLINCAGLHSDRITERAGERAPARIVPFRGEYYELVPERRSLVKGLIYPVPNPDFPFLGVHFTRMIDGSVHAGPNAVLAFRREGYHKTDLNFGDLADTLTFGGFWRMAAKHWREGSREMWRSWSRAAFLRSLQELIPEVQDADLRPCAAGVRAQALLPSGQLVDDFLVVQGRNSLHVCNAPSPAATASIEIGRYIADQIPASFPG
ncbi:MAG: L-2-hydroxyglutarate oxidase [Verrucomicrobiales bacterium]|nr:L-2-hydroxyglutarate oxidase [Verrucomicrobiales bacterium]